MTGSVAGIPPSLTEHATIRLVTRPMRVHDRGSLGHVHFGAVLDADRSHAHDQPPGFDAWLFVLEPV
jgi:hypothetical protein